MNKRWVQQWDVRSSSNPAKFYKVSVDANGHFACACMDWINRRQQKGEHCKHIKEILILRSGSVWVTVGKKRFLVQQDPRGGFSCTCREWRKKRTCAHTIAVMLTGGKSQDIRQAIDSPLKAHAMGAFGSFVALHT